MYMYNKHYLFGPNLDLYTIRLRLYSILKSDWSGTWLLLPIDAMYCGFYCVRGLRHVGTAVGWNQVEGQSHLTARTRVTNPFFVIACRG